MSPEERDLAYIRAGGQTGPGGRFCRLVILGRVTMR